MAVSHTSVVQTLLSLHLGWFGTCVNVPEPSLHTESVQSIPSSTYGFGPGWQPFGLHCSLPLPNSPSLQTEWSGALMIVSPTSSQVSIVHATLSSGSGGVPAWQPSVA